MYFYNFETNSNLNISRFRPSAISVPLSMSLIWGVFATISVCITD